MEGNSIVRDRKKLRKNYKQNYKYGLQLNIIISIDSCI